MSLRVLIDGVPFGPDEARAFWARFSDWLERNPADLAGFARSEGLASVRPELHDGEPALVASRTASQTAYAPARRQRAVGRPPRGRRRRG